MVSISQFLLTFLLNAIWQIALITLVAAVSIRLLGHIAARYRYILWAAALSLSLLLPVYTSLQQSPVNLVNSLLSTIAAKSGTVQLQNETPLLTQTKPAAGSVAAQAFTIPLGAGTAILLCAVYLLFVFYRGVRLYAAWRRTRALGRGSINAPLPDHVRSAIAECKTAIGVKDVTVLFSNAVDVPVTIGALDALIILPSAMFDETERDVLITALGHELVHVRRRDYISNLVFELIWLPISFHPAARYAKRRVAQMREICCDDVVANRLLRAEDYARSLVSIAGLAVRPNQLARILTVGITDAESLEVRIMSLLQRSETNVYKKSIVVCAAVLLLAVPFAAAALFAPSVGVNDAAAQNGVKPAPTPPDEESTRQSVEKLQAELNAVGNIQDLNERKARQQKLEKQIVELKAMQANRAADGENRELIEKLKLAEIEIEQTEVPASVEQLKAVREKLELELNRTGGEVDDTTKAELRTVEDHAVGKRLLPAKLDADAKIKMERATEIALGYQPGTVVEKVIGVTQKGEIVFSILIRDAGGSLTEIKIDGVNGNIISAEKRQ